jgi:ADP-ribosylation factor 2-binding protein
MASTDFVDAQLDFIKTNMDKFDEEEENKIEYTGIYETYVGIMEKVIDEQLSAKFSEERCEAFYQHFQANYPKYEKVDQELVEKLFTMIDFLKFKETMLNLKKSITQDNTSTSGDISDMANIDFLKKLHAEDPNDPNSGWNKKMDFKHNGDNVYITIWAKKVEGYPMDFVMWEGGYKDIDMESYKEANKDWESLMKSGASYDQLKVLSRDSDGNPNMCYSKIKFGMLMTDRDALTEFKHIITNDEMIMEMTNGVHSDYPVTDDCIRIGFVGFTHTRREGQGLFTREVHVMKMGGYIP